MRRFVNSVPRRRTRRDTRRARRRRSRRYRRTRSSTDRNTTHRARGTTFCETRGRSREDVPPCRVWYRRVRLWRARRLRRRDEYAMNERRVTHLWLVRAIVVRRLRSRGRVVRARRRRREASWSGEYVYDTHGIVTLPIETSDSRLGARGVDFLTFPFGISVGRDVFFHRANLCVVGNARRVVSLSRRSGAARRRRGVFGIGGTLMSPSS